MSGLFDWWRKRRQEAFLDEIAGKLKHEDVKVKLLTGEEVEQVMDGSKFTRAKPQDSTFSVPPMSYVSTPPYTVYAAAMTPISAHPLRITDHTTLEDAVGSFCRFQMPFVPHRAAGVVDSERQIVFHYVAQPGMDPPLVLSATHEGLDHLSRHRPADEVSLWELTASASIAMPLFTEGEV